MITVFDHTLKTLPVDSGQIADIIKHEKPLWIHLEGDNFQEFKEIAQNYNFHHLAIETIISPLNRTKISRYNERLLITTQIPKIIEGKIDFAQIGIFVRENVVITIVNKEINYAKNIQEQLQDAKEMAHYTVDFMLYGILDCIVDDFLKVAQSLDEDAEDLEGALFEGRPDKNTQKKTFRVHRNLTQLRRTVLPMREVINSLLRWEGPHRQQAATPYFQAVYDHVILASEWSDSARDMVSNVFQAQIALQGNDLNVTMKKVTSWAAIIGVPAAVTGFYGMNVPYPGNGQMNGFYSSLLMMSVSCLILWVIFKKKDWL